MPTLKPRVRFAPSPTGMLHVGNARTALYNWLFARHTGGEFLLRIEDTDVERSEERFETQLIADLRWLGLDWTEGPLAGGPHAPYRQSERLEIYRQATDQLLSEGKAYRCFCAPEEFAEDRGTGVEGHRAQICSGNCKRLRADETEKRAADGRPFAVRLAIPDEPLGFHDIVHGYVEFSSDTVSDPVLVRSSGLPVYNYVVTLDDAIMEITHVIRGDDHLSNTPKQVAIYRAFGWKIPEFAHLSTILGGDRERLSKRHGATSIASMREMGIIPEALTNYLALLGWGAEGGKRETFTLEELTRQFTLERVTPSPAVFDWDKLYWLNRHYLKLAPPRETEQLAWPYFAARGWLPATRPTLASVSDADVPAQITAGNATQIVSWFGKVVALYLPAVDRLEQLPEKAAALWLYDAAGAKANPDNQTLLGSPAGLRVVRAFAAKVLEEPGAITPENFKALVNQIKTETGIKGAELFHPIRIMLTGTHSGPEFDKLIPLIEDGSRIPLPAHVPSVRERVVLAFEAYGSS